MADAHAVAGIFGNIFAFFIIITPALTFFRIKQNQSVGERAVYPYVATWCNAAALIAYAAPVGNWLVLIINLVALVAETAYSGMYYYYAEGKARMIAVGMLALELEMVWGCFLLFLYCGVFCGGRYEHTRIIVYGWFVAVTSFLMYALLIFDTYTVVKTKDVTQMNIYLVIASFFNCVAWTVVGAKAKPHSDRFIMVPNGCGIVLTFGQALVWLVFFIRSKLAAAAKRAAAAVLAELAAELAAAVQQSVLSKFIIKKFNEEITFQDHM